MELEDGNLQPVAMKKGNLGEYVSIDIRVEGMLLCGMYLYIITILVQMITVATGRSDLDAGLDSLIGINNLYQYINMDCDSIMQSD